MPTSRLKVAGCTILLIISAYIPGIDGNFYHVNAQKGDTHDASIITIGYEVDECYLTNPNGDKIEFKPVDKSDDKFELLEGNFLTACTVRFNYLDVDDTGEWMLTFVADNHIESVTYNITVTSTENYLKEDDDQDDEMITRLSEIKHFTSEGRFIDITLDKINHEEECYVLTPDNQQIQTTEVNMEGIRVQNSSQYVSCRITIGPVVESLLDKWSLCGKHLEDQIEYERCQPITIAWASESNPSSRWNTIINPTFNHPVNYGGRVNPAVRDTADIVTCHVVTPDGEDLVITPDVNYPNIARGSPDDNSLCSIVIDPIESIHLGQWTIYGKFYSFMGLSEVQQPITMNLYNVNDPYEQAYNVTNLNASPHIINLGATITIAVTDAGETDSCEIKTPLGEVYTKSLENISLSANSETLCQVTLGPISESMLGEWLMVGKFNKDGLFSEIRKTFYIIQEDPENPTDDIDREITYEAEKYFDTEMGASHTISLTIQTLTSHEASCHIRTPDGLQYTIMEGFNVPGIEVVEATNLACTITVNVISEDVIGNWMLISRLATEPTEKRLNFTIYVTENVNASPKEAVIAEGNDFYIRLEDSTELHETCSLFDPSGKERVDVERNKDQIANCGFVIRNVNINDDGLWEIRYGTKIDFRASSLLTVNARSTANETHFIWIKDRPVNETYGPEDTVYCKVEDSEGFIIFNGFGRCTIALDRASLTHAGIWKFFIGLPGRVLTDEHQVTVEIVEAESKPSVTTYVTKEAPSVMLSCSVSTSYQVRACKFRNPSGQVLLASNGVGEDRYNYHGIGESFKSEVHSHDCGLRITNPIARDLGIWRCAIETEEETYYGFLTVLCPWAMQDPEVAASVVSEPTLTVDKLDIIGVEDDTISVSCSIQAPLRYCYFRAPNGTIYPVGPGNSHDNVEYIGNGLDSGDCGARFTYEASDSGIWSCHVGLTDVSQPEQRASYSVTIREAMIVNQYRNRNELIVEGRVYEERDLEYCRFVRTDGLGFTGDNAPNGYRSLSALSNGHCVLVIDHPNTLDTYLWTVVAKIRGQDTEISRRMSQNTDTPTTVIYYGYYRSYGLIFFLLGITLIATGMLMPPKNRKWTYSQAASLRRSFRNSFQRKAVQQSEADRRTPMAA